MAVQARFPPYTFSPDFRNRVVASSVVADELEMLQDHRNLLCTNGNFYAIGFPDKDYCNRGGAAFSNDPQKSELTCNENSSKKRARGAGDGQMNVDLEALLHRAPFAAMQAQPFCFSGNTSFDGQQMVDSRLLESTHTSTSGRSTGAVASAPSILSQDLLSNIYQQNLEIDALVRLQNERLRRGLEEAQKRHCQVLLASLEHGLEKRLKDKEKELDNARLRNAELEEKLRQISAENQIWFTVARNNEAIVSGLRSSLEQVILQNVSPNEAGGPPFGGSVVDTREGYGDSEFPVEDTRSCCFEDGVSEDVAGNDTDVRRGRGKACCKGCGDAEVCVLLLPCRHLCLCKDCESKLDTCPVCQTPRNASLQIFIP